VIQLIEPKETEQSRCNSWNCMMEFWRSLETRRGWPRMQELIMIRNSTGSISNSWPPPNSDINFEADASESRIWPCGVGLKGSSYSTNSAHSCTLAWFQHTMNRNHVWSRMS
jgi:hypothetical protein